jgi:hypothetical protein
VHANACSALADNTVLVFAMPWMPKPLLSLLPTTPVLDSLMRGRRSRWDPGFGDRRR